MQSKKFLAFQIRLEVYLQKHFLLMILPAESNAEGTKQTVVDSWWSAEVNSPLEEMVLRICLKPPVCNF